MVIADSLLNLRSEEQTPGEAAGISETVQVLTLADDRYAMPLAVMVRSLLDHLEEGQSIHLCVIDGGILAMTKEKLVSSWRSSAGWKNASIEWRTPDYGALEQIREWGRVPKLTYARINLASYLPKVAKVIVLDSDVLVRTDIARLWKTQTGDSLGAAVVDPFVPTVSSRDGLAQYARLGLRPETPYLNAGVMLINLELWRERNIGAKTLAYVDQNWQTTRWCDQDAINAVLAGQWTQLESRWQAHPRLGKLGAMEERDADPWIVHFSGRLKPWSYRGKSAFDREFFEVLDRTQWQGWRPRRTLYNELTGIYETHLRRWLYPVEVRALGLLDRFQRFLRAKRER